MLLARSQLIQLLALLAVVPLLVCWIQRVRVPLVQEVMMTLTIMKRMKIYLMTDTIQCTNQSIHSTQCNIIHCIIRPPSLAFFAYWCTFLVKPIKNVSGQYTHV